VPSEKKYSMSKKEEAQRILNIIQNYKSSSNKDLVNVLEFLGEDFTNTKNTVLKLVEHLDKIELTYNTIIKEYESRTGNVISNDNK
jgi:arginine repressor